jgi:hypothetical protein
MVQSVQVVTTVSTLPSSSGIVSAEASRNSIGTDVVVLRSRAMRSNSGEGSSPKTARTVDP